MMRLLVLCVCFAFTGRADGLPDRVNAIVKESVARFGAGGLTADKLGISVRDLSTGETASYRGEVAMYPASVVKLFYLVAIHQQMESGKAADTPELRRAMNDMIVNSTNEATALVVDTLTGTTSGPELPTAEMSVWLEKRNWMNRYFADLGYSASTSIRKHFQKVRTAASAPGGARTLRTTIG